MVRCKISNSKFLPFNCLVMLNRIIFSALKNAAVLSVLFISSLVLADAGLNVPLPVDPDLKLAKLKNGLTYYIKKNNTPKEKVELRLVVKFGSVDESDEQLGAAHFIEHLAFKNSRNFKNNSVRPKLASIGIEFGRDLNAHTEFDLTRYEISLPSNKKSHLQIGLQTLADFAAHVDIRPEDITGEEEIVAEEQRLRNNLDYRKTMAMLASALPGTQYSHRSPIGVESVRKTFTASMLQQLYRQRYLPDQMAVMVVGDVDVALVEKMIQRLFSASNNQINPPKRAVQSQAELADSRLHIFSDEQQSVHELVLTYAVKNEDDAQTKAQLREAMIRGRYVEMVRNRLSYFDSAYRSANGVEVKLPGKHVTQTIKLEFPKGGAAAAIKAALAKLKQIQQFGFRDSELEEVKKRKLSSFQQTLQERDKIESFSFINDYMGHFVRGENLRGTEQHWALMQELYPTITLADVNDFAKTQFASDVPIQFIYSAPKKDIDTLPSLEDLTAYIAAANQQEVREEAPRKGISSLMKTPPATAGEIISESYNALYGTTEMQLSNGITVLLKKTDFTNQKIAMFHQRYGGISLFDGDYLSAIYAPYLTQRMGFDQLAPRDVQEFLQPKNVFLNLNLSYHSETISGDTSTDDLETLLQWNYQRVTNPSRSKGHFAMSLGDIKKSVQQLSVIDDWIIQDQFFKLVFNHDPRLQILPRLSEIETLNIDKVLANFDRLHANFDGNVFAFVGNVDISVMRGFLKKYLANLPGKKRATPLELQYPIPQIGIVKKDIFVGNDNKARVYLEFHGEFIYTDEDRLRFKLFEDILQLRLTQVLREQKHLIYMAGVGSDLLPVAGGRYRLIFTLPCAPDQTDAVLEALFYEIANLQKSGPTIQELEKVKKAWAQAHKDALRSNSYWASHLLESKLNQQPAQLLLSPEKLLNRMTLESMKVAANQYLDMKNYVQLVVRPQSPTDTLPPEILANQNFVPRDLGFKDLQQIYRRGLNIGVAVMDAIKKAKSEYVFSDRSADLGEVNQLSERLDKLSVSSCLAEVKRTQGEVLKSLVARIDTVNITGTSNVLGEKLTSARERKYFELLGEQNKLTTIVKQGMDKCEDGAPEK